MFKTLPIPERKHVPTSAARDRLPGLIQWVQNPRHTVVLTRYGRGVAALVSMEELAMINRAHEVAEMENKPEAVMFTLGKGMQFATNTEAAAHIRDVQLDRLMERRVLEKAGLEPIAGGEVAEVAGFVEPKRRRRWWWFW